MKITLSEEKPGGAASNEITYDKPVIGVGRDAGTCDIVFAKEQFPMVSRVHAEIRWHDGRWYLVDQNSSYGTFLNGERIMAPFPLTIGSRIQIGQSGPVLKVLRFDTPAVEAVAPAVRQAAN